MAKTIAIVNQKGGVGKTTTCVNLAAALKNQGCRVLVCDFDPQANTTSGFGVDKTTSPNIYDVLLNGTETAKAISSTSYGDVLPSNKALAGATIEMIALEQREYRLKNALEQVAEHYDYIFIDCPPSLELLTLNALCAADTVLVPVQCEYYALEGLSDLLSTIRIVKRSLNPKIALEGVVLTMYDGRTNLSMQVAEEVKRHFPGQVYATVIPRNVRLSEAPSFGKPVSAYDALSRGAEAYDALAQELLEDNQYAVKLAGLSEIPAVIIEADDRKVMELGLIENLQREDLNPIEEANGYKVLMSEYGLTQEEVAQRVGKSRPAVANALRLLTLPDPVHLLLEEGKLSAGHARAILAVPSGELQKKLAQKVIAEELSVRQTEALAKRLAAEPREAAEPKSAAGPDLSIYLREAEKTLATRFGRKVHIINGRKKGKIELEYYNPEDLNTLLELLEQLPSAGKGGVSL